MVLMLVYMGVLQNDTSLLREVIYYIKHIIKIEIIKKVNSVHENVYFNFSKFFLGLRSSNSKFS